MSPFTPMSSNKPKPKETPPRDRVAGMQVHDLRSPAKFRNSMADAFAKAKPSPKK